MKFFIITTLACVLLANVANAEPMKEVTIKKDPKKSGPQTTQVIPGVSITIDDGMGPQGDIRYVPVKSVYINAGRVADTVMNKGDTVTSLSISITPPDNTEIKAKIVPDNKDAVAFNLYPELNKIKKGQQYSFSFSVVGAQSGTIKLFNSKNKLVGQVPYRVNPYKSIRQSLSTGLTSNVNVIGGDFDSGPNVNVSYSRSNDSGKSSSVGISAGPSGASVNANMSWSW